jgi:hypothetical protein
VSNRTKNRHLLNQRSDGFGASYPPDWTDAPTQYARSLSIATTDSIVPRRLIIAGINVDGSIGYITYSGLLDLKPPNLETHSFSLQARTHLLHRNCAYGRISGVDHECAECSRRRPQHRTSNVMGSPRWHRPRCMRCSAHKVSRRVRHLASGSVERDATIPVEPSWKRNYRRE